METRFHPNSMIDCRPHAVWHWTRWQGRQFRQKAESVLIEDENRSMTCFTCEEHRPAFTGHITPSQSLCAQIIRALTLIICCCSAHFSSPRTHLKCRNENDSNHSIFMEALLASYDRPVLSSPMCGWIFDLRRWAAPKNSISETHRNHFGIVFGIALTSVIQRESRGKFRI